MKLDDVTKFREYFRLKENMTFTGTILRYHGFAIADYYWAWSGEYIIDFRHTDLRFNGKIPTDCTFSDIGNARKYMAENILPHMYRMTPFYIMSKCLELYGTTPYKKELLEIARTVKQADRNSLWFLHFKHDDSHAAAMNLLGMSFDRHHASITFNV